MSILRFVKSGQVPAKSISDCVLNFFKNTQFLFGCYRDPADMSSESDNAMTSSTVSKLAEARRTTYLSGRWVCDDHNGDTSISITGPWITLPNNGDYSAYYNWVEEKKTTQGPGEEQRLISPEAVELAALDANRRL